MPPSERVRILQSLHDDVGHWDQNETFYLLTGLFWCSSVKKDVESYLKTCDDYQQMKPVSTYINTLNRPIKGLLEIFSIDFAGPFPVSYRGEPRLLLVCSEHLNN